jgi:hypothetical protein
VIYLIEVAFEVVFVVVFGVEVEFEAILDEDEQVVLAPEVLHKPVQQVDYVVQAEAVVPYKYKAAPYKFPGT